MARFDIKVETKVNFDPDKVRQEVAAELYAWANDPVFNESQDIVPVDTGALMNSGNVSLPDPAADPISVTIGYGNVAVDYALAVHENLNAHVKWTRPGSGPKYLERPFEAHQGELPERIKGAILRGLES